MKVFNLAIFAVGIAIGFGAIQTEAQAASFNQIINLDAKQNSTDNPISIMLSAGTYAVDYIGMNDGGAYDGWNAWEGKVERCDRNRENCRRGWKNRYGISFDGMSNLFTSGKNYATASQAMQNAVNTSFTVASDTTVNFFINDKFYDDNIEGVSLRLSSESISQSVPEPTSMLGLLAVGTIGVSTLKRKKQAV
ncbi:PEP-CTERM sorting domain-containing protein [Calothrix sp. CCY 0018]|uniref:PEP-CTERM sorting domain-containing protein n=1 Tax=Calothrix sp. CCY 0018 TaxID=3103864 RepID=UPI0039C69F40